MKLAGRMSRIGTESAFEVLRRALGTPAAQGRNIIHLEIGEPDFPTPKHIVEAGKTALDQGFTHYSVRLWAFRNCASRLRLTFRGPVTSKSLRIACAWCRAPSR